MAIDSDDDLALVSPTMDSPAVDTPAWMSAADNHNIASGNASLVDSVKNFASGLGDSLMNAPKFTALAIGSGVTGVLNSGIAAGNWVSEKVSGSDITPELNFKKWVADYDTDLGKYYRDNADSIDTLGFIGTSLIPGTIGVKAFNLGQKALQIGAETGFIGKNLSWATNLLTPSADTYIARAAQGIAQTNSRMKLLSLDTTKAIASGFGQAALESLAFETAVTASSFRSPFMENMEAGDIAWNMATGVLLGGAIGGIFHGVGAVKGIKSKVIDLDSTGKQAIMQDQVVSAVPTNFKAANEFKNRETIEAYLAEAKAGQQVGPLPDPDAALIVSKNISNAENSIKQINNNIRTHVQDLTTEKEVGNVFADTITKIPSRDGANLMVGAESLFRVADAPSPVLTALQKATGTLDLGIPAANKAEDTRTFWNKIWGDGEGKAFDTKPDIHQIADRVKLKSGQSLDDAVNTEVKSYKFKPVQPQNVLNVGTGLKAIQARYAWSSKVALQGEQKIVQGDFPMMEAAYHQFDDVGKVTIVGTKGATVATFDNADEYLKAIVSFKDRAAARLITKDKVSMDEIAERLNMKPGHLDQTATSPSAYENYFYKQGVANRMGMEHSELFNKPSYMGVKTRPEAGQLNELGLDAETLIANQNKAAQQIVDNATEDAARIAGQSDFVNGATGQKSSLNMLHQMPEPAQMNNMLEQANRFGVGGGLFTFVNGTYGSIVAAVQQMGGVVSRMERNLIGATKQRLSNAQDLLRSDATVAADFGVSMQRVRSSGETYVLRQVPIAEIRDAAGNVVTPRGLEAGLIPKKIADGGTAAQLNPGAPEVIRFSDPRTAGVWQAHISLNAERQTGRQGMRAAQGLEDTRVVDSAYAIPPDPRKLPYFVFVKDASITGAGKQTMMNAATADNLEQMVRRIKSEFPEYQIIRKDQSEEYHKALGDYDYDKTLHENHVDSSLASRGISAQALPRTDGNYLADQLGDWHQRQASAYVRDIMTTKYETFFRGLAAMGREQGGINTSRYSNMAQLAEASKNNPYMDIAKTALNISRISDYPLLAGVNQALDGAVSSVWNRAADIFKSLKGVTGGELDQVNKVFADHGFKTAYYDAATSLLANHTADQGVLSKFIRGAQSILATTYLRMDFLNGINNKLGSTILTSTEFRHLLSGIEKGDATAVGALAGLKQVIPGTTDSILSPTKIMMKAMDNFWNNPELRTRYIKEGWIPESISDAFKVVDNLTIKGGETSMQMNSKLQAAFDGAKKIGDFGEKITGNKFFEQLNRFMAADSMRQVTDIAVGAGLITERESKSYINTFVNRTQVNLVASQRPLAFQGPIGMAMGLFQSYQFNLMQQLFRYVEPGARKSAAQLLGLQGSIYGMNGLPGFQAFNEHIIGRAAGNDQHKDIGTATYQAAGYELGNFALYGIPSNLLRANLYTRGDLTPQHPTILPSSITDLPVVSIMAKFFGNMKNTVSNVANGAGIWNSILTGLEHNSVNRPLAGLAQVLRGANNGNVYATDNGGNLLSSNDLFSISSLARLAGGKPLDESVVRDEAYRIQAYKQSDMERRKAAGASLKVALADGGEVGTDAMNKVFDTYLGTGGKQASFNKWYMGQFMGANASQSFKLSQRLSDPYSQRMQQMLGGGLDENFQLN